jgi:hypothetical protein
MATVVTILILQKEAPIWVCILIAVAYAVVIAIVAYYNYFATALDTEDPIINIQRSQEEDAGSLGFSTYGAGKDGADLHMWCKVCDCYVNESTKHCG